MVGDKDDYLCFPVDLFDGVEVAHSIYLVETAVDADAWTCSPAANGLVGIRLEFAPPTFAPLPQKGLFIRVLDAGSAAGILIRLAFAAGAIGDDTGHAENAAASRLCAVYPFAAAGCLKGPGVGNDALDARGATAVEGGGRELELRGSCRHAHGCVDVSVAVGGFVVVGVVARVAIGVVTILGMKGFAMGVA